MTLWVAVIAACLLAYALKLSGYLVPESRVSSPAVSRILPLLPVALLASLVVTQAFLGEGGSLVVDARAAAVGVAVVLFWLRVPFLVVVVVAAATAALLRAGGIG